MFFVGPFCKKHVARAAKPFRFRPFHDELFHDDKYAGQADISNPGPQAMLDC